MLSVKEEEFLRQWEIKRITAKTSLPEFIKGLSRGLIIGVGILIALTAGWYKRANMEANAQFNPFLLVLILLIVAIFIAFVYRQYHFEQQEQLYKELLAKKKRSQPSDSSENIG